MHLAIYIPKEQKKLIYLKRIAETRESGEQSIGIVIGKLPMQHFQKSHLVQVFASTHQLQSKQLLHLHLQRHYIEPMVKCKTSTISIQAFRLFLLIFLIFFSSRLGICGQLQT
jgi:hypothetical protein